MPIDQLLLRQLPGNSATQWPPNAMLLNSIETPAISLLRKLVVENPKQPLQQFPRSNFPAEHRINRWPPQKYLPPAPLYSLQNRAPNKLSAIVRPPVVPHPLFTHPLVIPVLPVVTLHLPQLWSLPSTYHHQVFPEKPRLSRFRVPPDGLEILHSVHSVRKSWKKYAYKVIHSMKLLSIPPRVMP